MSILQHSQQVLYLPPGLSLPREQLAAMQHVLNNVLRAAAVPPPPPPYNPRATTGQWYRPRMDMYESSGAITATFELPGLRKEDIHIDVVEGRMVVVGERHQDTPTSAEEEKSDEAGHGDESPLDEHHTAYTVREIKRGRFKRVVQLPAGTKLEDIKASMHDGFLTVTYPGAPRPVVQSVPIY